MTSGREQFEREVLRWLIEIARQLAEVNEKLDDR